LSWRRPALVRQRNAASQPPGDHLLAKEVDALAGPAAAQLTSSARCFVNDRESPWMTLIMGTRRARAGLAIQL